MCLWNKILVWLLALTLLGCLFFMARTLKTHDYWRSRFNNNTSDLENTQNDIKKYLFGHEWDFAVDDLSGKPGFIPGIPLLKARLERLRQDRGLRAWFACVATPGRNGDAEIAIPGITDKTFTPNTRLFIFEDSTEEYAGKYLGAFFVKTSGAGVITVVPDSITKLNSRMIDSIAESTCTWTLYTIMPTDNHGVMAGKTPEELAFMLPTNVVKEYTDDGKPDPETGVVYERPLIAFDIVFEMNNARKILLKDLINAGTVNLDIAQGGQAAVEEQLKRCQDKKAVITEVCETHQKELDTLKKYHDSLNLRVQSTHKQVLVYDRQIRDMAKKITELDRESYKKAPK